MKRTAGLEALSPVAGWGLFHDLPAFMLGADLDPAKCEPGKRGECRRHADRALVQEAAVVNGEHAQLDDPRDAGLLAQRGPLTVFNSAEDGAARRSCCRAPSSAPRRFGATARRPTARGAREDGDRRSRCDRTGA